MKTYNKRERLEELMRPKVVAVVSIGRGKVDGIL